MSVGLVFMILSENLGMFLQNSFLQLTDEDNENQL